MLHTLSVCYHHTSTIHQFIEDTPWVSRSGPQPTRPVKRRRRRTQVRPSAQRRYQAGGSSPRGRGLDRDTPNRVCPGAAHATDRTGARGARGGHCNEAARRNVTSDTSTVFWALVDPADHSDLSPCPQTLPLTGAPHGTWRHREGSEESCREGLCSTLRHVAVECSYRHLVHLTFCASSSYFCVCVQLTVACTVTPHSTTSFSVRMNAKH